MSTLGHLIDGGGRCDDAGCPVCALLSATGAELVRIARADLATDRQQFYAARNFTAPVPTLWARGYPACVVCGTTTAQHAARGRCGRCYVREQRSERGA